MNRLVIVRGGGDIATGVIYKLSRCGYPVLALETARPSAIRRQVSFSEAVYDQRATVEGMTCYLASDYKEAFAVLKTGSPAILVDPECGILNLIKPWALVDAILAKRNLGTTRDMAQVTIALGPGFEAGKDVDLVVETMRGHQLGRVISRGYACKNTGIPGKIAGYDRERVIRAPAAGTLYTKTEIGSQVNQGETIAVIQSSRGETPVTATLTGILRGLLRDGYPVTEGFKMADIDPRLAEKENCATISDKARCIAGGVLEGILSYTIADRNTCRARGKSLEEVYRCSSHIIDKASSSHAALTPRLWDYKISRPPEGPVLGEIR